MHCGAVKSAMNGKRGQKFLRELLETLDNMPEKKLISNELIDGCSVCALGSVFRSRGISVDNIEPDDFGTIANKLEITNTMAREVMYENDYYSENKEPPEGRWRRVRAWVKSKIKEEVPENI